MRHILIAAILVGCGGQEPDFTIPDTLAEFAANADPSEHSKSFDLPCIGRVTSARPVYKVKLAQNLLLARRLFDDAGIIPAYEFCSTFENVTLTVRKEIEWEDGDRTVGGTYNVFYGITTNKNSASLAHELLHHWDSIHLQPGTFFHTYWDVNGYDRAWKQYMRESQDISVNKK